MKPTDSLGAGHPHTPLGRNPAPLHWGLARDAIYMRLRSQYQKSGMSLTFLAPGVGGFGRNFLAKLPVTILQARHSS